ncbi:hypothetical protein EJ04DRAFT_284955 [Polyplosphaeria fusca]|uniref:Uncharacterized protein n=1 Tax=Polyplosphaeria fusca TaxID=682080 RepID=A0A9P4V8K5_9PLEO|nr:hypothetical protein EJ04DRAFT_284955 [Polyplosphaeria fusca]
MAPSLLSLPTELRELVYEQLFSQYTVRHGFGPATLQNRAALLQTCKLIYAEAWRFLPLNIKFHFRGTESMLETLLKVDQSVITRLRHIRVKAFPFPLYSTVEADFYATYYFYNALALFPGLHLHKLIVDDAYHGSGLVDGWRDVVTYFDFEMLLKSDAWRELEYTTPNTDFITSGYDHRRRRVAQPEGWDTLLQERDGEDSGATVQMFLAPDPSSSNPSPIPRPWSARPGHEIVENWRLASPEQDLKGKVTIIARRGKRAKCVQLGLTEKRTWEELKGKVGGFVRKDWTPHYNDMADTVGWIYGGWGRRMQLANQALNH